MFNLFFFICASTTEIYTLSLHDALPIYSGGSHHQSPGRQWFCAGQSSGRSTCHSKGAGCSTRSEEHTSELQSQFHLVCRLLLEKKNTRSLPVLLLDYLHHLAADQRVDEP